MCIRDSRCAGWSSPGAWTCCPPRERTWSPSGCRSARRTLRRGSCGGRGRRAPCPPLRTVLRGASCTSAVRPR
eukprot:14013174-Alexandrium_andersonii.AAC.1